MSFRSHDQRREGRELYCTESGAPNGKVVIAWRGLARNGRDSDDIAAQLSTRYHVICPDTLGLGLSQWRPRPEDEYCLAFYARLSTALLDQLGIRQCHSQDTSMGSAVGLKAAANSLRGHIRRLVLKWSRLIEASIRRLPDGPVTPHDDPAMLRQFIAHPTDYDQWDAWDRLELPVLALGGIDSDLLLPEKAGAMRRRGPEADVVTIPDCSHAPALNMPE